MKLSAFSALLLLLFASLCAAWAINIFFLSSPCSPAAEEVVPSFHIDRLLVREGSGFPCPSFEVLLSLILGFPDEAKPFQPRQAVCAPDHDLLIGAFRPRIYAWQRERPAAGGKGTSVDSSALQCRPMRYSANAQQGVGGHVFCNLSFSLQNPLPGLVFAEIVPVASTSTTVFFAFHVPFEESFWKQSLEPSSSEKRDDDDPLSIVIGGAWRPPLQNDSHCPPVGRMCRSPVNSSEPLDAYVLTASRLLSPAWRQAAASGKSKSSAASFSWRRRGQASSPTEKLLRPLVILSFNECVRHQTYSRLGDPRMLSKENVDWISSYPLDSQLSNGGAIQSGEKFRSTPLPPLAQLAQELLPFVEDSQDFNHGSKEKEKGKGKENEKEKKENSFLFSLNSSFLARRNSSLAYVSSTCRESRDSLVLELSAALSLPLPTSPSSSVGIASYGSCLRNSEWPLPNLTTKVDLFRRHKFCLAIDNCFDERDYVTQDKLGDCLYAGSLPIYKGAPNIALRAGEAGGGHLPSLHSALVVDDFASLSDLAQEIRRLDRDDKAYLRFFEWRTQSPPTQLIPAFKRKLELLSLPVECRICLAVQLEREGKRKRGGGGNVDGEEKESKGSSSFALPSPWVQRHVFSSRRSNFN